MTEPSQQLSNHARFHPPFHFFLVPVLLIHVIWSAVQLYRFPGWDRGEALLLSLGLVVMGGLVRINALKAQDRVIRLEEQLRYSRVLDPVLAARACSLPVGQIVALRFASDAELAERVEEVLARKVGKSAEIKKAIVAWRGDYFRV